MKQIKQMHEDIQRTNLQIVEKERQMEQLSEKEQVFASKIDQARDKYEGYRMDIDILTRGNPSTPTINMHSSTSSSSVTPKNRLTNNGGSISRGKSDEYPSNAGGRSSSVNKGATAGKLDIADMITKM